MIFEDRKQAGTQLTSSLIYYKDRDPIILALPRGGIEIGFEIAKILHVSLNVLVSRKIGSPGDPEFGIGAIAEGNVEVFDESILKYLKLSEKELRKTIEKEKEELEYRIKIYRKKNPLPSLKNKIVILVDDGVATGITARAAIISIRKQQPKEIVFASPVCAYDTAKKLSRLVDRVICLTVPADLASVGQWYKSFNQISDERVVKLLEQSKKEMMSKFKTYVM